MRDSRISFRDRNIAAILAFLLPGAGHWYQGRRFKAAIFSLGVLSLFVAAMAFGAGQPVYSQTVRHLPRGRGVEREVQLLLGNEKSELRTRWSWGYAAQFLTGLPALPALLQQHRFQSDTGMINVLEEPLEASFEGLIQKSVDVQRGVSPAIYVTGTLKIRPEGGRVVGSFSGVDRDGDPIEFPLSGAVRLGCRVFGSPKRLIEVDLLDAVTLGNAGFDQLKGSIPRSFVNWFQAPKDNDEVNRLHLDLSHQYDIACLLSWIAGLLNMMVIWDAYDGPAYGYGDEEPENEENEDK